MPAWLSKWLYGNERLLKALLDAVQDLRRQADRMDDNLVALLREVEIMAGELDALKAQVEQVKQVDQAAVTLLQGLKGKLDAALANNDMGAVKALSDEIGTQTQALADAITANTPTAPSGVPRSPQGGPRRP